MPAGLVHGKTASAKHMGTVENTCATLMQSELTVSVWYVSFERAVRESSSCEIHTFDPTVQPADMVDPSRALNLTFHNIGLSDHEATFIHQRANGTVAPLSMIMSKLGHTGRQLTVLKVDCEGCEYGAFSSIFDLCASGKLHIGQLAIELHLVGNAPAELLSTFFHGADKCGLMIFHKERNHWGCDGYICVEYSFISKRSAWIAFQRSQCPTHSAHLPQK